MVLQNTEYSGSLELFILGSILVTLLIAFLPLTKNINKIIKAPSSQTLAEDMETEIVYIKDMWNNRETIKHFDFLLKSYILNHYQKCKSQECPITSLFIEKKIILKKVNNKKTVSRDSESIQITMLNYIYYEYMQCIKKNTSCVSLRLSFALFQIEQMKNSCSAIGEIIYCENNHPNFIQQFLMYRYKQLIKECLITSNKTDSDKVSIASAMAYDSSFKLFSKKIEQISLFYNQFWSMLSEESPDMVEILRVGFKILTNSKAITNIWTNMQKINPNIPKALRLYAGYFNNIVNDKEASKVLFSKAEDFSLIKANFTKRKLYSQSMENNETLTKDGTPCILISGQASKLGVITDCNLPVSRIFGYNKNDIIGSNIKKLMPEIYAKYHDEILKRNIEYSNEEFNSLSKKDRLVFALHKNKYIFPVWMRLISNPSLLNNNNYVGFMNNDKSLETSSIAFVLFDKQFNVLSVSTSAIILLEIDTHVISSGSLKLNVLAPDLTLKTDKSLFYTKAGSLTRFYFPERYSDENGTTNNEIKKSNRSIDLNCQIIELKMGKQKYNIGYCAKFSEIITQNDENETTDKKIKFPNFRFRYDGRYSKFVRDILTKNVDNYLSPDDRSESSLRSNSFKDFKNDNVEKGQMSGNDNLERKLDEDSENNSSPFYALILPKIVQIKKLLETEPTGKYSLIVRDLTTLLGTKRVNYGKDIITYRLIDGQLQLAPEESSQNFLINSTNQSGFFLSEDEEKLGRSEGKDFTGIAHIRSRVTLQARIIEVANPRELTFLLFASALLFAFLIAFALSLYILSASFLNNSSNRFQYLQNSSQLISEIQHAVFLGRECIFTNNNITDNSKLMNFPTTNAYMVYLQSELENYLITISSLTDYLSNQKYVLDVSSPIYNYYHQPVINLSHKIESNLTIYRLFTFPQATEFLLSNMFDMQSSDSNSYSDDDYNSIFVVDNGFNAITEGATAVNNLFVQAFLDESEDDMVTIIILVSIAIGISALFIPLSLLLLKYAYSTTQFILILLLDLPYKSMRELSEKAERFQQEVLSGQYEDNEIDDNEIDKIEGFSLFDGSSRRTRRYKNTPSFLMKATIMLIVAIAIIDVFFGINYYLENTVRENYKNSLTNFNMTMRVEEMCKMALNYERECFYTSSTLTILGQINRCALTESTIEDAYELYKIFDNPYQISPDGSDAEISEILYEDLCTNSYGIVVSVPGQSCQNYLQNVASKVKFIV